MLCKKTQLAILDEVVSKSDGEKPVTIDLSDPVRNFNFWKLKKIGCFEFAHDSDTQEIAATFDGKTVFPIGLSEVGYNLQLKLTEDCEIMELRRFASKTAEEYNHLASEANKIAHEANKLSQGANTRATWAMGVALLCAMITSGVLVAALRSWWGH